MPTIARIGPYRFLFYGNEGRELPHVHVQRDRSLAKFRLTPIALARSRRFAAHELAEIERLVRGNENRFPEAWNDFFNR
jgi:hypothetical protein